MLFADLLDLPTLDATPVRQLSLGQRMRAEIATCLLPDPQVIFLDEPTIELDLVLKQAVRDLINQFNTEGGTTVMLTTHDIDDITGICDRALGVVHSGTVRELLSSVDRRAVVVELTPLARGTPTSSNAAATAEMAAVTVQSGLPGAVAEITDARRLRVEYQTSRYRALAVVGYLLEHFELADITVPDANLESVLRRIYSGDGSGRPAADRARYSTRRTGDCAAGRNNPGMSRYMPFAGASVHALMAYRSTILLSAVTTGAATALQVFLWLAVYAGADQPLLPVGSLISYVVMARLLGVLHNNKVDEHVSGEVYRGDIAVSLGGSCIRMGWASWSWVWW